ncbi:MAG: hypothetical protein VX345_13455, partial [Pseudomonadota bacterium]|nr:hypothetical protein [Pseudomonadota bacterium]
TSLRPRRTLSGTIELVRPLLAFCRSDTAQLMALFAANKVAIVMDGAQFVGMITRVDLINHLRQSVS